MPERPRLFSVFCPSCNRNVAVSALASARGNTHDYEPPLYYYFSVCPDCRGPLIVGEEVYAEDATSEWRVHPPEERLDSRVPTAVQAAYQEASACLRVGSYTAAAIMCRRAMEATCQAQGATTGSLKQRLEDLRERKVLDARLYEWADELRNLGNDAAHDVKYTADKDEAKEALEFTRALIEFVFVINERFKEFKRKRAAAAQSPAGPAILLEEPAERPTPSGSLEATSATAGGPTTGGS